VPAEAVRNQEEGKLECFGCDGKAPAYVHLHTCGPEYSEEALATPPAIARFESMRESNQSLRALSLSNDRTVPLAVDSVNPTKQRKIPPRVMGRTEVVLFVTRLFIAQFIRRRESSSHFIWR
jgi:hypothetical protein